ncbi:MAG: MucB/RseB C-terminal domain-containing protein [Immundisolibacter sp.]
MRRTLLLLALAVVASPVGAADTPAILQRMLEAARTLNYRGHVVQIEGYRTQALELLHRAGREAGEDRVRSLQGAYWELERSGSRCRVALGEGRPARDEALVAATFPSLLPRRLERLAAYYDFSRAGSGRLAGRQAEFTVARPRDEFRFGYLLGTDAETGLLLKASLMDGQGRVLRQAFFVNVEFLPLLPDAVWEQAFEPAPLERQWTEHILQAAPLASPDLPWHIGALPAGFTVDGYQRRRMPGSGQEVEQLTVSDGLATVSVFIDASAPGDKALLGAGRIEAVPVFGAQVGDRHVTALGAAPVVTLQRIVDALTPAMTEARPKPADAASVEAAP